MYLNTLTPAVQQAFGQAYQTIQNSGSTVLNACDRARNEDGGEAGEIVASVETAVRSAQQHVDQVKALLESPGGTVAAQPQQAAAPNITPQEVQTLRNILSRFNV